MDEQKKVVKYRVLITVAVVLLFLIVSAVGIIFWLNSGIKQIASDINANMAAVKVADTEVTVTDAGVKVYGYKKTVTVNGANAEIYTVIGSLQPNSLEYQETTSYDFAEGVDLTKLFGLHVLDSVFEKYDISGDKFEGTVKAASVGQFFGNSAVKAASDATVTMTFVEGKLTEVNVQFGLESGKILTLIATYTY